MIKNSKLRLHSQKTPRFLMQGRENGAKYSKSPWLPPCFPCGLKIITSVLDFIFKNKKIERIKILSKQAKKRIQGVWIIQG